MLKAKTASVIACAMAMAISQQASATPLTVLTTGNFVDLFGSNPIGNGTPIGTTGFYAGSLDDSIVAWVTPNPASSPASTATVVTARQGGTKVTLPYNGSLAFPNQYFRNVPYGTSASTPQPPLVGPWTLTITNATASGSPVIVTTPALSTTTPPTPAQGIAVAGSGLAPTVSWTAPAGSTATSQTVYIFKVTPGTPSGGAVLASAALPPGATSYTFAPGHLVPGQLYSISVQSDVYGAGGGTGLANLQARTRVFTSSFTATSATFTAPVYLPGVAPKLTAAGVPVYTFAGVPVVVGQPILVDPEVATGFIYETGVGDPKFASVRLPDVGNTSPYSIYVWDGTNFVFDALLAADTDLSFGAGVSKFEVLGIDPSLGLNPLSATDFVTQLTFTGTGTFNGTMTPVVAKVPEPSALAALATALAGLAACMTVRNRKI